MKRIPSAILKEQDSEWYDKIRNQLGRLDNLSEVLRFVEHLKSNYPIWNFTLYDYIPKDLSGNDALPLFFGRNGYHAANIYLMLCYVLSIAHIEEDIKGRFYDELKKFSWHEIKRIEDDFIPDTENFMVAANIFLYLDRLALAGVCHKETPSLLKIFDKFIEKIELFESFKVWQPNLLAGDSFITVFEALINDRVKNPDGLDWVMIRHPKMFRAFIDAMEYAFDDEACLIVGETGTGKETLARCIHAFSGRSGSKFVPINCGAFTDDLFVSAIQGHAKGAFTGATHVNPGIFLSANGGTVFLDEMSSLNPRPQAVLLRTIQFGEVQPVGKEYDSKTTDVRVIGSLNSDPLQLIREGKLREDLYFRMTKGIIKVPPLRELIDNFDCIVDGIIKQKLKKKNATNIDDKSSIIKMDNALPAKIIKEFRVSKNAMRMLKEHVWPGNFRELDNVITQALKKMSRSGDVILKPIYIENLIGTKMIKQNENNRDYSNIKFKDLKKEYLTYIHKKASGKPFTAEKLSGMGRKAIERCWDKYGLPMPGKRG